MRCTEALYFQSVIISMFCIVVACFLLSVILVCLGTFLNYYLWFSLATLSFDVRLWYLTGYRTLKENK